MSKEIPASPKEIEGYAKQGTTLEGRVAQLLRIQGHRVIRNHILEDHEIDVYAEGEDGKRILVECKEYYRRLVDREKVLIFAMKVRDIKPDEAWFVTISDFEPPAHELCRRYGIYAINGFELEELEEKAAEGPLELGPVPEEDRILRLLKRKRTQLRRRKRRGSELKRVAEQIYDLTKPAMDLPTYLFPIEAGELERKHVWLTDIDRMEKKHKEGTVHGVYLNPSPSLRVRAFGVTETREINLLPAAVGILIVLFLMAFEFADLTIAAIPAILLVLAGTLRRYLKLRRVDSYLYPANEALLFVEEGMLYLPEILKVNRLAAGANDILSTKAYEIRSSLADGVYLGYVADYLVDKSGWNIVAAKVSNQPEIAEGTGRPETIVPVSQFNLVGPPDELEVQVGALYVLGETFLTEELL